MSLSRQTQSVKLVWQVFEKTDNAYSVVELVQMHKHTMNKTTVYRILERFEKDGRLHTFWVRMG